MNFQTMSKQRKFILIASAAGIVSMFLPWVSISIFGYTQSVNGMHDIGILVFLCFIVSAALAYLGDQTKHLDKNMWAIVLVAGAIAILSIIYFYFKMSESVMGTSFVGFGLYISAIAALGVLGSAYMFRSPTDNIKDSFNDIKRNIESKMGSTSKTNEPPANNPGGPNNLNPPL
ncbi:MAG: hypothetical protein ABJA90_10610 [Ginsengibacter sp.]